jgi:hypothetical protein
MSNLFGIHVLIDIFFLEVSAKYIFFIVSFLKDAPESLTSNERGRY